MLNFNTLTIMKKIKLLISILLIIGFSCNEEEWLEEVPLDFYAPENMFTTPEHFNAAVARVYEGVGKILWESGNTQYALYWPSDQLYMSIGMTHLNAYKDVLLPEEEDYVKTLWDSFYRVIFDANVVIGRIDDPKISFISDNERNT